MVDFKIGFLNDIPVIWTVFALVTIIGAIYYFAVQRNKPFEAVRPPEEEDLSGIAPGDRLTTAGRAAGPAAPPAVASSGR